MKKIFVFLVLILVLSLNRAIALEKLMDSKIADFVVYGNTHVKSGEILSSIFSKVGEQIDQSKIKNDLKAIYALGYFQDVSVSYESFGTGTRVVYTVIENPLLETLKIKGNTIYPTSEVVSILGLKPGDVFNYKILREGIESINNKYKQNGYTLAKVVDVSSANGSVEVSLVEGIVEAITLEGNESTKDYVILREMNTKPGKVFNEDVFSKDLRRIFNLGFFSEIIPAFEPGSSSDKIFLSLKIKETRTNTINFGGGYGEREGWFGFIDLAVNNLLGTAQGLMIRGQSGQQLTTYQFKYTNPWFLPDKLGPRTSYALKLWDTMGTDIYVTQQDERHTGWDMTFGKTLSETFGSSFSFGSENVSPRNGASFEAYTSNSVGISFSFDTRDFWMNPTKGIYHVLSVKQGWTYYTSSQSNFFKIGLDLNGFKPLAERQVLAGHLGLGVGFGSVPIGELYWAGGPNTVRGYSINEMKRGSRRLISNLEYRFTFNETFQAVLFFDWGNAWLTGNIDVSDFIAGWGPGVRVNTPLGPIRLDYGLALNRNFGEGILHFSIGQAF